jgi:tRNA 2-selenouridine synthase
LLPSLLPSPLGEDDHAKPPAYAARKGGYSVTPQKINIIRFLELTEKLPVVDVRSPSEFLNGHIPGAFNIPLFNDSERAAVGTIYKKGGRIPAILEGLKLTGPSMEQKLKDALRIAINGKLLLHCWRGGMRSEAMAWLFSLGDIEADVLEGGYKAYRHFVIDSVSKKRKMIVLGGMTGSSKTHIIKSLNEKQQQVIDLEGLANHKGSAFGSLGQPPQPSTEQFTNNLFVEWIKMKPDIPFWVEDESRNIGTVFIPDGFYLNMQDTPAVIIMMDVKTRLPRLMKEYSVYPAEVLIGSIQKISKRLGGDNTSQAIKAVETGDISKAIEISLSYYDKAYLYGLNKKKAGNLIYVETDTDDIEINSQKILEAAKKIVW